MNWSKNVFFLQLMNQRISCCATITTVIFCMLFFMYTENVLNSDAKAQVLLNNVPLKYYSLLCWSTQQQM